MKQQDLPQLPTDLRYLRKKQIVPWVLPVSEPTFYRLIRAKRFPRGVTIGRIRMWSVREVLKAVEALVKESEGAALADRPRGLARGSTMRRAP
jgi:predicted DNA-binding transcriptional regulator AlpA